jgi:hypothetical protein
VAHSWETKTPYFAGESLRGKKIPNAPRDRWKYNIKPNLKEIG